MKKILLTLLFLAACLASIGAQNISVPPAIAKKIGTYCRINERALALFLYCNPDLGGRFDYADRALYQLELHPQYAKNFIVNVFDLYGTEMGYFTFKDMWFTPFEFDIAKQIYNEELEKRKEIRRLKEQERELAELKREQEVEKRCDANDIFSAKEVTTQPEIQIDLEDLDLTLQAYRIENAELWDADFSTVLDYIVSVDGSIRLADTTQPTTKAQKIINEYILTNSTITQLPEISLPRLGIVAHVNCKISIGIIEHHSLTQTAIQVVAKKNKKEQTWEIKNSDHLQFRLNLLNYKHPELIEMDLVDFLYHYPKYKEIKKGLFNLNIYPISNQLQYFLEDSPVDVFDTSYTFNIEAEQTNGAKEFFKEFFKDL